MVRIVKRPEERRKEIVELATKLFWQNNYEQTSMNQIVSELNIAKGTIYHYFKSKEELMFAVIEEELLKHIEMILLKMKKAPKGAVEKFIYLMGLAEEADQSKVDHLHQAGNSLIHTRFLARLVNELAKIYADVIEEGCEQGVFKTKNPLESAEFLLAGFSFIVDIGIYPWEEETLKRRMKAMPALLEAQLNAPKGAFKELTL